MREKKLAVPPTVFSNTFEHLSDLELLRLHSPVTGLECALYARLSSCMSERDAIHADLTPKLEVANEDLENIRSELAKAEQLNSTLYNSFELLKNAAQSVIDHWDQGNLVGAMNDLREVMDDLQST